MYIGPARRPRSAGLGKNFLDERPAATRIDPTRTAAHLVLVTARPVFSLPFKSLKEVTDTREALAGLMHLQPRGEGNL